MGPSPNIVKISRNFVDPQLTSAEAQSLLTFNEVAAHTLLSGGGEDLHCIKLGYGNILLRHHQQAINANIT